MSTYRFTTGQQFLWKGNLYEVRRLLAIEQMVNLEALETGAVVLVKLSELTTALFAGELNFELNQSLKEKRQVQFSLSDYLPEAVEIARWRFKVIEPLLNLTSNGLILAEIDARVQTLKTTLVDLPPKLTSAISRASVYRWLKAYQQGGSDLRALIPQVFKRGGVGQSRLTPAMEILLQGILREHCYRPEKVALDAMMQLVAARLVEENQLRPETEKLQMPSRITIARRIAALDQRERFTAQHGKRAARREFDQVERMVYPQFPYERVEIDHTRCDILVIDERDNLPLGRPTLTHCLDLATRYPLGHYLGFEPPSYFTVMECLYHAICPKENTREKFGTEHEWLAHGIPSTLVVDNGKEFIGRDLSDACELLGIVLQQCPLRTPELKAGVERYFRTLNSGVFHTLPGTTFSNIFERGEYASVQQACISLSELDRALTLFLVDIYAERYHRGLNGIPARRWEQALAAPFVPRLPPSRDELYILLGRVEWRTVQPYGIEFECLRYNAAELGILRAQLKGDKVKIKYHPGNLSRIYVYNPFERCYYEVPALDQEYTQGLSFWKHRVIRRVAQLEFKQVDLAALGRARCKIQDMVDAARTRQKKTSTRAKLARWESGQPQATQIKPASLPPPGPQTKLEPANDIYDFDYSLTSPRHDSVQTPFGD
ncbi:MAG: Mu transposase C-terminal domain-containing protein [Chloroflexota bacterium]